MGTARGQLLLQRMCSSAGAFVYTKLNVQQNSLQEARIHLVRVCKFSPYLQYGCKGDGWCLSTSRYGVFNDIRA